MMEVQHLPQEIHIAMGDDTQGKVEREELISYCVFNYFAWKFLGAPGATAMTAITT